EEHDCKLSFRRGGKTLAVATMDATARAWKANSPWRELSRLVKPDNRLRHIAAAREEVHYVGICCISNRCRSTRGDHAGASRPASGVPPGSRQRNRLLGNVSRRTSRA